MILEGHCQEFKREFVSLTPADSRYLCFDFGPRSPAGRSFASLFLIRRGES
jgi:hypothetical protein